MRPSPRDQSPWQPHTIFKKALCLLRPSLSNALIVVLELSRALKMKWNHTPLSILDLILKEDDRPITSSILDC